MGATVVLRLWLRDGNHLFVGDQVWVGTPGGDEKFPFIIWVCDCVGVHDLHKSTR